LTLNALRGFVHLLRQGIRCLCMSPQERMALWISAKVAVCCVAVIALPGIVCAWVLARGRFTGKALLDTVVHAPLVIPSVVSGYLALLMLGRHGILGRYLYEAFGISLAFTWKAAVVASAIMAFPLMVRPVRAALEQVDRGIEQAASTLGAGRLRVFVTVTLPLAMPGLVSGLILAFARSLGEFGATITFAANIEGETRTLPLAVYTLIQTPGGDGPAMRLVVISVLLSVGALALSEVMSRRFTRPVGVV
jgi:molybdate transport system permease protein